MPPVHLPNAANVFLRLAVVIGTYIALHVSMRKPNPPPSKVNRKQASRIENASTAMLRPFTVCFSVAPVIIELAAMSIRLAAPPVYDIVSGTCAEQISFDILAPVGLLLSLCGMGIRLWCYQALGPCFTFELALLPNHKLITTGPYTYVRHPSYTGGILALVGMSIVNMSKGSWAYECGFALSWWGIGWGMLVMISMIILIERCPREDRFLREVFKEEWDAWRERVRWRMIPWVY